MALGAFLLVAGALYVLAYPILNQDYLTNTSDVWGGIIVAAIGAAILAHEAAYTRPKRA